jgi:3-methylornithyl-N6-L-lysine dehydrogenase
MTRLRSIDIADIAVRLDAYDADLLIKTGRTLRGIACYAAGQNEPGIAARLPHIQVGVVPIQWGLGKIDRFAETTRDILIHLGFQSFVTQLAGVSGLAEAYAKEADLIFLADDDQFAALNTKTREVISNADATGRGFAGGLALMVGGLKGQRVLVLGCGPVGAAATAMLLNDGAAVAIYDINGERAKNLAVAMDRIHHGKLVVETDLKHALARHHLLVDATDAAGFIRARAISGETYMAAPGVPLGLNRAALKKISGRLLHDPLQIGVATMAMVASTSMLLDCT